MNFRNRHVSRLKFLVKYPLLLSRFLFELVVGENRNGRASRGVAQHLPGSGQSSLEGLRAGSATFVSDVRKLHMQVRERGEKLSDMEEKTEQMNQSAMRFSSDANAVGSCLFFWSFAFIIAIGVGGLRFESRVD